MSEVNNFINNNIRYNNIEPVDKTKNEQAEVKNEKTEAEKTEGLKDTGVLGRSQVKTKGADIAKSVDDAVEIAQKYPNVLECGDYLFEKLYQHYLDKGMEPNKAYCFAAEAMEELRAISVPKDHKI